jgi:hypothetical protein
MNWAFMIFTLQIVPAKGAAITLEKRAQPYSFGTIDLN